MRKLLFGMLLAGIFPFVFAVSCSKPVQNNDNPENPGGDDPEVPEVQVPFNFTLVSAGVTDITVEISANDPELTYICDAISKDDFQSKYGSDTLLMASTFTDILKNAYDTYGYDSFEQLYDNMIYKGTHKLTFDGYNASTGVYVMAYGLDREGNMTTDPVLSELFMTKEASHSDNTFEIKVTNNTVVTVTPSNKDTYCFDLFSKDLVLQYGGAYNMALAYIDVNKDVMSQLVYKGEASYDYVNSLGNNYGRYVVIAFGYEGGCITTDDVTVYEFDYR